MLVMQGVNWYAGLVRGTVNAWLIRCLNSISTETTTNKICNAHCAVSHFYFKSTQN